MWQVKKIGVILFAVVLVLQAIAGSAIAATFYVDDDETGNYTKIQAAVNDATSGDIIIVKPGIYSGNIEVNVDGLTIASESGNPEDTIIQVASDSKAFYLQPGSGGTTIKGFTIKGSGNGYGINFDVASSCNIENNKFSYLSSGVDISLWIGGNQSIINNEFSNCDTGIAIFESIDNKLKGNNISNCEVGIQVISDAPDNFIIDNNISNCSTGLWLDDSLDNQIYNNYFSNNVNLKLVEPDECTWNTTRTKGQNIIGGSYVGGNFWGTPAGDGFSQTHLDVNGDGIAEEPYSLSERNIDYMPLVTPGMEPAPSLPAANFQTNTSQGSAPLSVRFTDLSKNVTGRIWDFENDGTVDSTGKTETYVYTVPGTYTVNLTAINENGTALKLTTITVTEASGNNSVNNETENNGTNEDNGSNSNSNSNNMTGVDSGSSNGDNVSNGDNGNSSDSGSSNESSSGGSSHHSSGGSSGGSGGGSGGGGAGGSPEPAKNVEVKELSQAFITNGKEAKFDFSKNATCVVYVSFDSKKTLGKTTTIAEMLKNKSALVSELPAGEVYKSFNVWVGNGGIASSKNIENPAICFKVEKSWLQDKSIDLSSITLNWCNDKKWEQLPVNMSGEDASYLYFTANVSGYSFCAITGKAKSAPEQQETSEQQGNNLTSIGSVRLTNDTNDTVIKEEAEKSAPGFEMVFGIVCLLGVLLYRRK